MYQEKPAPIVAPNRTLAAKTASMVVPISRSRRRKASLLIGSRLALASAGHRQPLGGTRSQATSSLGTGCSTVDGDSRRPSIEAISNRRNTCRKRLGRHTQGGGLTRDETAPHVTRADRPQPRATGRPDLDRRDRAREGRHPGGDRGVAKPRGRRHLAHTLRLRVEPRADRVHGAPARRRRAVGYRGRKRHRVGVSLSRLCGAICRYSVGLGLRPVAPHCVVVPLLRGGPFASIIPAV